MGMARGRCASLGKDEILVSGRGIHGRQKHDRGRDEERLDARLCTEPMGYSGREEAALKRDVSVVRVAGRTKVPRHGA